MAGGSIGCGGSACYCCCRLVGCAAAAAAAAAASIVLAARDCPMEEGLELHLLFCCLHLAADSLMLSILSAGVCLLLFAACCLLILPPSCGVSRIMEIVLLVAKFEDLVLSLHVQCCRLLLLLLLNIRVCPNSGRDKSSLF